MIAALEGIMVVSLEQAVAAPLATARLADAGARVIKLERPEGDFARGYDDYARGQSTYFVWLNRGKESCRVDLKNPEDLALVERLLVKADVFVQNLAPGATSRLGLRAQTLRARHPSLIVCEIGGYAPDTPDYQRKAYDLLVQADAGLSAVTGSADSGPSRVGVSICDIATGQAAYAAILEAVLLRQRDGQGRHLQVSLFDTIAEYMNVPYLTRRYGGIEPPRLGLAHPSIAPYGGFEALDGSVLISIQNEREWAVLCDEVLKQPELASDLRFSPNIQRVRNRAELDGIVQTAISRFAVADLCTILDTARIAYSRISTVGDLIEHRSATTMTVSTPVGEVELLAPPVIVDGQRHAGDRVCALGEHDEAVRREFSATSAAQRDLA